MSLLGCSAEVFDRVEQSILANNIPFRAMLELTYPCNFSCVHCYIAEERATRELTTAEWRQALDGMAEAGTR